MKHVWPLLSAALLLIASCKTTPSTRQLDQKTESDATTGIEDPRLADLVGRYWAWQLETRPVFATMLGVHDYDDRIDDNSKAGIARYWDALGQWLKEAKALDASTLSAPSDQTTLELFMEDVEAELGGRACQFERWSLSPRSNPVTEWSYLPELHPLSDEGSLEKLERRVAAIPGSIRNEAENLRSGVEAGLFANHESTRRVIEIVEKQLAAQVSTWPMVTNLKFEGDGASPEFVADAKARIAALVESGMKPALRDYLEVLRDRVLPGARPEDQSGLSALALGTACYASQIRRHTSLTPEAAEVHEIGLREIARLDAAIAALGAKLFGAKTLAETLSRLRSERSLYFDDEKSVEDKAKSALAAAKAAIPRFFGTTPKTDCVVTRIPDYEAPYTTIAYYRPPIPGEKPGEYFINVYAPETRPRYEAAVLAYHESIPGHHLQIAIAQELPALPSFRKHLGLNVFVEGWALYTEQLADEMGLYADDLDRMGMLSFDAWRASRLVVDTGIHAFGWSREKAKAFMMEHTALAANNVDNEVDRYIVWPGQALGYKLGQLEIWKLRKEAEAKLGDRFSLPSFHDAVLTRGAVSMKLLRAQVEAFISESEAGKGP